jgi:hypothetical protein
MIAHTEFIVVIHDDVFVEPAWLDELLKAVNPTIGMVTPGHKNLAGDFVHGGIVMRPDQSGHHTHILSKSRNPRCVQSACCAVYLLDVAKCGHLRADEQYPRHFFNVDLGMKVWETGFKVICTTSTVLTHSSCRPTNQGLELLDVPYEEERQKFKSAWIETGRYWKLEAVNWRSVPDLRPLVEHPGLVGRILDAALREDRAEFDVGIMRYCDTFGAYPALLEFAENAAVEVLAIGKARSDCSRTNLERFIAASQQRRAKNPGVSSSRQVATDGSAPWQPPMEEIPLAFFVL